MDASRPGNAQPRLCACGTPLPRCAHANQKWCSDRCRKNTTYGQPCALCGAPMSGGNGAGREPTVCIACDRVRIGERRRARWASQRAAIERLWAEGLTGRQIRDALGLDWSDNYATKAPARLRQAGYNLPHRRPQMALNARRTTALRLARRAA